MVLALELQAHSDYQITPETPKNKDTPQQMVSEKNLMLIISFRTRAKYNIPYHYMKHVIFFFVHFLEHVLSDYSLQPDLSNLSAD